MIKIINKQQAIMHTALLKQLKHYEKGI